MMYQLHEVKTEATGASGLCYLPTMQSTVLAEVYAAQKITKYSIYKLSMNWMQHAVHNCA